MTAEVSGTTWSGSWIVLARSGASTSVTPPRGAITVYMFQPDAMCAQPTLLSTRGGAGGTGPRRDQRPRRRRPSVRATPRSVLPIRVGPPPIHAGTGLALPSDHEDST